MNVARCRRYVALSTERLKNHVAEHVSFRFRFADLAYIDKLLNQRLIFGSESNLFFANNVGSTVANLDQIETAFANGSAGESCTHACAAGVFLTLRMNRDIRVNRGALQTF